MVLPVMRDAARRGLDQRRRRDTAAFQRQRDDEGLHRRAGLEGVGQRAVAQLRARQVLAVARVEAGVVGQRQHLARAHVEHDHAAGLGAVLGDGVAHALVGKELHLRIDRQLDVAAVHRVDLLADVLDHAAETVAQHRARPVAALQLRLEGQLDALLALFLDVGEAHDVRRGLTLGVVAPVLAQLVHALQPQRLDLAPECFVDLAAQPGKVAAGFEPLVELGGRHAQQPGQRLALLHVGAEVLRDRPRSTAPARWWPAPGRCGRAMRPRLAGTSSTWAKRFSPCCW